MDSVKSFWENVHSNAIGRYLTGTPGAEIWDVCHITDLVHPGINVLNIGVGLGNCTSDLHFAGANVYVLDICQEAIDKVKPIIVDGWISENILSLPCDFFDLSISYLVAQHISDYVLNEQLRYVIRSLKKDGVFAMQFLSLMTNQPQGKNKDQEGSNVRSLSQMEQMVEQNGGFISFVCPKREMKNIIIAPGEECLDAEWQFIQIKNKI